MSDSPAKSVAALFTLFWDILRLRRGPEDLPASKTLLVITVALQPLFALLLGSILPPLPEEPGAEDHTLPLLAIDLIVPLLWGWLILQLARRPERYVQMMSAAFGCQLVLYPVLVPLFWITRYFSKESGWTASAEVLLLGLSVWLTIATARIIRSATDWPMFSCIALVIAQGAATYLVAFALFPDMLEQLKQGM